MPNIRGIIATSECMFCLRSLYRGSHVYRYGRQIRHRLNRLSRFISLPDDTITEISALNVSDLVSLSRTSSRCRGVLLSLKMLWNNIDFSLVRFFPGGLHGRLPQLVLHQQPCCMPNCSPALRSCTALRFAALRPRRRRPQRGTC